MLADRPGTQVTIGRITGVYGIRGWVRVTSYTRPPENLSRYRHWLVHTSAGAEQRAVRAFRPHAGHFVAQLDGCDNRDLASGLVDAEISVARSELPELDGTEYYWADLVGLRVRDRAGSELGTVVRLLESGSVDVMQVDGAERSRLIPFVPGVYVISVDVGAGVIEVDWHPED